MKALLMPTLALTAMSSVAMAEPVRLTDSQMDAVTAGQPAPDLDFTAIILEEVATVQNLLRSSFANRDFSLGLAFTDPSVSGDVVDAVLGRIKVLPQALLAAIDEATPSEDGPVTVIRPQFMSSKTRVVTGGAFDSFADIISGSPFDSIPTVDTGL